jgi:hypothetical protein
VPQRVPGRRLPDADVQEHVQVRSGVYVALRIPPLSPPPPSTPPSLHHLAARHGREGVCCALPSPLTPLSPPIPHPPPSEAKYPTAFAKDKHFAKAEYAVSGVDKIMTDIMTNGPVSASFTVYSDFLTYKSGVYTQQSGSVLGGHAVKIYGWGVEGGTPYWLVANRYVALRSLLLSPPLVLVAVVDDDVHGRNERGVDGDALVLGLARVGEVGAALTPPSHPLSHTLFPMPPHFVPPPPSPTPHRSWNNFWGDFGSFKIVRGKDECGIEDDIVTGTV